MLWSLNSNLLPNNSVDFQHKRIGETFYSLKIKDTFIEASGVLNCSAINKYGKANSTAKISVLGKLI